LNIEVSTTVLEVLPTANDAGLRGSATMSRMTQLLACGVLAM
jgi:hypothetical protein